MAEFDANATKADLERRMKGAVETLKNDLAGLRTGRANTSLLDPVQVEVYGAMMPLQQVATVTAPEPRMLAVQVWDRRADAATAYPRSHGGPAQGTGEARHPICRKGADRRAQRAARRQ
jgi:Ribosome recycling factor